MDHFYSVIQIFLFVYLNQIMINYILSSYFLQNDIIYHKVAAEIILKTGIISKKHFNFEKEIIKDCTREDILFLCRKLLGNIYDIEKLCDLFDSILQIKINDKDIAKIIFDVFLRLGTEYGIPVLEFVRKKNNSEDSTVSEFYTELLPLITNICKRNNNRELFPELFASYDQKIAASRKRKEENKEVIKKANSKSVVMNLVKSVSILYGKGFCYKMPGSQKSQTSNFSKIEQSFYLSKKDIFTRLMQSWKGTSSEEQKEVKNETCNSGVSRNLKRVQRVGCYSS